MTTREKKQIVKKILKKFGIDIKQVEINCVYDTSTGILVQMRLSKYPFYYVIKNTHFNDLERDSMLVSEVDVSAYAPIEFRKGERKGKK